MDKDFKIPTVDKKRFKLKPMSSSQVLNLSRGKITVADDISRRSLLPYEGGIHCQRIFGPIKDFECECGKLHGLAHEGQVCPSCNVEVNRSSIRKDRYGHIELPLAVINPICMMFLTTFSGIKKKALDGLLKRTHEIFLEKTEKGRFVFNDGSVGNIVIALPKDKKNSSNDDVGYEGNGEYVGNTADDLYTLINLIDLHAMIDHRYYDQKSLIQNMIKQDTHPRDFFIVNLLVGSPSYRPIALVSDMFVSKSTNDLLRNVIRLVIRINNLKEKQALSFVKQGEASLLQRAVNCLLVDGVYAKPRYSDSTQKFLAPILSGMESKQGIFRQNLLGKRTDYSGRSVIASDATLSIDQLALPIEMCYELFKPFILSFLQKTYKMAYKHALQAFKSKKQIVYNALDEVVKNRVVLMNRQPSLHRYSVMAFYIVLHGGKHIGIPALVCAAFGADFDGDQIAIHVPLSPAAQEECIRLLLPSKNFRQSSNGKLLMSLRHEAIIGTMYMTKIIKQANPIKENSIQRLRARHDCNELTINQEILFKKAGTSEFISTCLGRLIIGEILEQDVVKDLGKKELYELTYKYVISHNSDQNRDTIDKLLNLAFSYATKSGLSVSISDCSVMKKEKSLSFEKANSFEKQMRSRVLLNEITQQHADELIVRNWNSVILELNKKSIDDHPDNSLTVMFKSEARLSPAQFSQIMVAKGITSNARGEISVHPIEANYADGLQVPDYFLSCSAAHKAGADKQGITPVAGYFARQLTSATRELLIGEFDCHTTNTVKISAKESLGRFDENGEIITKINGNDLVSVRSPITCKSSVGICQKCFGTDPSTGEIVRLNSRIGLIAAQSISEPTTQLSMKSKHTSGAANIAANNTQIYSKSSGVVTEIKEFEDYLLISIGKFTYTLLTTNIILNIKLGDVLNEGDLIAEYSDGISQIDISGTMPILKKLFNLSDLSILGITATQSGTVTILRKKYKQKYGTHIFIGDAYIGMTNLNTIVATGEFVEYGQLLTKGIFSVKDFYKQTGDLEKSASLWLSSIHKFYLDEGTYIKNVNFEVLFRSMTDLVQKDDGRLGVRSLGHHGIINLLGVSAVAKQYPSWLKSMGFGFAKVRLEKALLDMQSSIGCETEQVMFGDLLPQV